MKFKGFRLYTHHVFIVKSKAYSFGNRFLLFRKVAISQFISISSTLVFWSLLQVPKKDVFYKYIFFSIFFTMIVFAFIKATSRQNYQKLKWVKLRYTKNLNAKIHSGNCQTSIDRSCPNWIIVNPKETCIFISSHVFNVSLTKLSCGKCLKVTAHYKPRNFLATIITAL